jgi:hypothetical protein
LGNYLGDLGSGLFAQTQDAPVSHPDFDDDEPPTTPDTPAVPATDIAGLRAQLRFEQERTARYLRMMRGFREGMQSQKALIGELRKRIEDLEGRLRSR